MVGSACRRGSRTRFAFCQPASPREASDAFRVTAQGRVAMWRGSSSSAQGVGVVRGPAPLSEPQISSNASPPRRDGPRRHSRWQDCPCRRVCRNGGGPASLSGESARSPLRASAPPRAGHGGVAHRRGCHAGPTFRGGQLPGFAFISATYHQRARGFPPFSPRVGVGVGEALHGSQRVGWSGPSFAFGAAASPRRASAPPRDGPGWRSWWRGGSWSSACRGVRGRDGRCTRARAIWYCCSSVAASPRSPNDSPRVIRTDASTSGRPWNEVSTCGTRLPGPCVVLPRGQGLPPSRRRAAARILPLTNSSTARASSSLSRASRAAFLALSASSVALDSAARARSAFALHLLVRRLSLLSSVPGLSPRQRPAVVGRPSRLRSFTLFESLSLSSIA